MDEKEYTERRRGEHLLPGVVKVEIIEYILSKNGDVSEPDIRSHLREKPEIRIRNKRNVSKHLERLGSEYHCIEKFPSERDGYENKWDIKTSINLQSIKAHYPNIQMKKYPKAIMILFQKSNLDLSSFKGFFIYILLLTSSSYLNKCVEMGIKRIDSLLLKAYQKRNGYQRNQYINNFMSEVYNANKKRKPNNQMSIEEFKRELEKMEKRLVCSGSDLKIKMCDENPLELSIEKFNKIIEDDPDPIIHEISYDINPKISDDLENYEKYIYYLVRMMKQERWDFEVNVYNILFDQYITQDIVDEINSDDIEFIAKARGILNNYFSCLKLEKRRQLEDDYLKLASEIAVKYQQPLISGKTFNNSDDAYKALKKFLKPVEIIPVTLQFRIY